MDGERDPSQGAKNRATARRTASEKKGGKMDGERDPSLARRIGQRRGEERAKKGGKIDGYPLSSLHPFFRSLFPSSRLSPLSERLEQARVNQAALCRGDLAGFLAHLSRMATFLCSDLGSFHSNPLSESLLITARAAEQRGDWEGDGTREPASEPVTLCDYAIIFPTIQDASDVS